MAGQAVGRDHPDPAVDAIFSAFAMAACEVMAQTEDLVQRIPVEEHREIDIAGSVGRKPQGAQPLVDVGDARQFQARAREYGGQWVRVVGDNVASLQRGLHCSGAAAAEWVVNDVAFVRQPLDEVRR